MNYYDHLFSQLLQTKLKKWIPKLQKDINNALDISKNSDLPDWQKAIVQLPLKKHGKLSLVDKMLTINGDQAVTSETQTFIKNKLQKLHPWRKGPFNIYGLHIDTEWRSDWKWERLNNAISSLNNKTVLDVGCGNGYHCFRMGLQNAKLVIGVDPVLKNVMQFHAINAFVNVQNIFVLPLRLEDIPQNFNYFDTVFSMGLLYHQKSPMEHLINLQKCLSPGGELVLETLVIKGNDGQVFVPPGRYAKMRNVWFIPTPKTLAAWMKKCGFVDIEMINVTTTSIKEQRSTTWMREESLPDFLDKNDHSKTLEGHPAPVRAILIGKKR